MFKHTLEVLSGLIILMSLIPLIRNDYWIFRVFEYPRLQKLFFNFLILIVFAGFYQNFSTFDIWLIVALTLNLVYLIYLVIPFTIFSKKQILSVKQIDDEKAISLMIFNVFQYNRESKTCLDLIRNNQPDVVCLVETDDWWYNQVKIIESEYPYQVLKPLDNTYGILLFSKLELLNSEVLFRVKDDIPSIETELKLRTGQKIKLYCVHPEPPVPQENPKSTSRDKELLLVAKEARELKMPCIVMGDLNDVAWSYTTELFCKTSELLDPRKGRGFFNTFHAKNPFLRFPLDHVFCSKEFAVVKIKRLPFASSDHFPMYIKLQYAIENQHKNEVEKADSEDKALAEEKINATE